MRRVVVFALLIGCVLVTAASPLSAQAAAPAGLPSHGSIVNAAKRAMDYYRTTYPQTTLTPRNGWSWSTYHQGAVALYRHTGDARYLSDAMAWGRSNSWGLTTAERNPDTIKAGEVYAQLNAVDPTASLAAMDARMSADLGGLALSQYDWIDALFMGLPNWARWAQRTGNAAYLDKMDALYAWTRDRGATSSRCAGSSVPQPGLFDQKTGLWYRDCTFVGTSDVNGRSVFWGRGNGWVIAAMADIVQTLPAGDARVTTYADMLRSMASRLVPLQGSDGFWRSSLLDTALYSQAETSSTGLITYALAAGVRSGQLDAATYLPVIAKAWQGLSGTALQPTGFITSCQPPGVGPAAPYTAAGPRIPPTSSSTGTVNVDSPPFCVGAFLLAATEVAQLITSPSTARPVTATGQQVGNGANRVNDGDVTTRWSASGFPQAVTIDLGSAQMIGGSMVVPYLDRAYRYRIESSDDRATWRLLVDRSANTSAGSNVDDFAAVIARYVRLTVVGVAADPTSWVSIQEFGVYPPPSTGATVYAADGFGRTVTGGLGTADVGGTYTLSGPSAAFSATGGVARFGIVTPGTGVAAYLPAVSARDVRVTVDTGLESAPTGGGTYVSVLARRAGSNDYRAKLRRQPSGAVTLSVGKVLAGIETSLASWAVPGPAPAASDLLRITFEVSGAGTKTLRAKVWNTSAAQPEPAGWQVTAVDSTPQLDNPGTIGLFTYLSGSATATTVVAFDNLSATGG